MVKRKYVSLMLRQWWLDMGLEVRLSVVVIGIVRKIWQLSIKFMDMLSRGRLGNLFLVMVRKEVRLSVQLWFMNDYAVGGG